MSQGKHSIAVHGAAHSAPRRSLILTIWAEAQADHSLVWRGSLELTPSQRRYFDTLSGLCRLLIDLGWREPPDQAEDRQAGKESSWPTG